MKIKRKKKSAQQPKAPVQDPKPKKSLDQQYFDEATGWETDRILTAKKSTKIAWIVASIAVFVAVCAVGAVAALAPFKEVEPFVVRVDNSTGMVDIVTAMKEGETSYEETINKYWINQYVLLREHWLHATYREDYYKVGLFSAPTEQEGYAETMSARNNPNSPLVLYGDAAEVRVKVKNISFINDLVAMVRFSKTVERAGERSLPTHWIATVPFTYISAPMKEKDRRINPLGFQVQRGYRVDPETVSESRK